MKVEKKKKINRGLIQREINFLADLKNEGVIQ